MSSIEQVGPMVLEEIAAEKAIREQSVSQLDKEQTRIKEAQRFQRKYLSYFPDTGPLSREHYPKHMLFLEAGLAFRQRAAVMGNRVGKSDLGALELTFHLTGRYPDWWKGKRFDRPIKGWAAGDTNTTVRDIVQEKLLGRTTRSTKGADDNLITGIGTGMIPGETITATRPRSGIPDAIEIVYVKHVSGGTSELKLKSYESGREAFQGTAIDVIWLDEECPDEIYTECLLRTMTTGGIVYTTFTPLTGLSPLVMRFLPGGKVPEGGSGSHDGQHFVVTASWDEAPHLTAEAKKELWSSIPPYQRDARTKGIPQLGSGAIYPVQESEIVVKTFTIPDHWKKCFALDVGWNRTATIWLAEDPQSKIWYAWSEHSIGREEPSIQAQAIRARGEWIPGVIDPASRGRSQYDGQQLLQAYVDLGLKLELAKNAVESGLYTVWQLFSSGLLKIMDSLLMTLEEYRVYRRDEKGHVVKLNDHLMDALRYAVMSGRDIARVSPKTIAKAKSMTGARLHGSGANDWMAS